MGGPTDFFRERRRRNVFKVGAAYAIVSWLILQFASTTFPALQLPNWAFTLVTVLIFIGFPFSLLFAWAFELTPEGVKPTRRVDPEASITPQTGQTLSRIVIGLLALAPFGPRADMAAQLEQVRSKGYDKGICTENKKVGSPP